MEHTVPFDFKYKKLLTDLVKRPRLPSSPKIQFDYKELVQLASDVRDIVSQEPSLLEVKAPCVIVGDIHGQYLDLHRIMAMFDTERNASHEPNLTKFLFLGDYIDRGPDSLDCITLLCVLKMIRPKRYNMLRGNHETQAINRVYGFFDEINRKIGNAEEAFEVWRAFNDLFAVLPLAAVVSKRILCMHGGISPKLQSLDDIRAIKRPLDEPNQVELACDLLWADPMTDFAGFKHNHVRGVSVYFGEDAILQVLEKLQLQLVVRAHQMMMNGYGFFCKRKLVTVFSAPRYYPDKPNRGAVMEVDKRLRTRFRIINPTYDEIQGGKFFEVLYDRDNNDSGYVSSTASSASASTVKEGVAKVPSKRSRER
ncbi:hypothetical protein QR680_019314 [Steinernema hermaphroditum]|uniref:Serine/threonine-protein phosphatase n=1 Tax=Steinernema hermaphroditum TaxID=289476 RepID=A0AA39GN90_9BILA|nr:hypothetical protein QR680_019314 [Steinernema hermaphroditum]